jgi:hypothetical protein
MKCGALGFVGKDGTPCGQDIAASAKGCIHHSPDITAEQRAAFHSDAVKSRDNRNQLPPEYKPLLRTREGIIATAEDVAYKVATGNMDVKRANVILKACGVANETHDGIDREKVTHALLSMEHGSHAVALYQRLMDGPMRALPVGNGGGEIVDVTPERAEPSTGAVVERLAEVMRKVEGPVLHRPSARKIQNASVKAAFAAFDAADDDDDEPTETVSWDNLKKPAEDAAEGGGETEK